MRRVENNCVNCPPEMGCLGMSCPCRNVVYFYCDRCGNDTTLYHYNGEEICGNCLLSEFEVVTDDDYY